MKYVLMFTSEPAGLADIDPEQTQAVYGKASTSGCPTLDSRLPDVLTGLAQLGPRQANRALADVESLAEGLDGYHLFHAAHAELLRLVGRGTEAAAADRRAMELTTNEAERRLLLTRLRKHPLVDGS